MVVTLASAGSSCRIYTLNGSSATKSASDWITNPAKKKNRHRRGGKGGLGGSGELRLLQDYDFPTASTKVKSTRDGKYLVATGTYKPRMKVWELEELGLKTERVTDADSIDFVLLSSDWTKSIHLHPFRAISFHTQSAEHAMVRIPRPGRSIAYHFGTCDALIGGDGSELWRFNLEQGRFLGPWDLGPHVKGVNAVDVNPAHGLVSCGTENENGFGTVELWDPRVRSQAGSLTIPNGFVSALANASDGLSLAAGTSDGRTFLYDLRSPKPFMDKDQGYSLPVKKIEWLSPAASGGSSDRTLLATTDSKVLKVWSKDSGQNEFAVNPPAPITDAHVYPGSGLILMAHDDPTMSAYFVPQLGQAPRWCRFLDAMSEEMEQTNVASEVVEDWKFVDKSTLERLGLERLIGTSRLRPYMHGFWIPVAAYNSAINRTQPAALAEYEARRAMKQFNKEQESRVRGAKMNFEDRKETTGSKDVQVNKALAQKLQKQSQSTKRKDGVEPSALLDDQRFEMLWEDDDFAVDEDSLEFRLVNPSQSQDKHLTPSVTVRGAEDLVARPPPPRKTSHRLLKMISDNDGNKDASKTFRDRRKF